MPIKTSSPFARTSLFVYVLLIIYATGFPFSGWHDKGVPVFGFLFNPIPKYWTTFDVLANVIGYVPFGILCILSSYPKVRGLYAIVLTIILSAGLSGTLEAMQTFLPSRISSNLDFLTNISGGGIGAILGQLVTPYFLERGRLKTIRQQWLLHNRSSGFILISLWVMAQLYPQAYLFGHGQITPIISGWLSGLWATPIDLSLVLRHGTNLTIEQYWLSEALITSGGLVGAILTALCLFRRKAPKGLIIILLTITTLTVKSLASALTFAPENAFVWLTPGAMAGLLMAGLMLLGFSVIPATVQRHLAFLMLLLSLMMVNIIPANPYFVAALQTWSQGKFLNFYGAAQGIALIWPFLALGFLLNVQKRHHP